MQDRSTGLIEMISEADASRIEELNKALEKDMLHASQKKTSWKKVPLFRKGEVLEIKEGKFKILKLTPLGMILKGVPDTTPIG